ncbi:MAG: glycosyltransferase family 39 protein [Bacteroidota bacterium]
MSISESAHTPSWHLYLLAFVGLFRFYNLGFLDLQAWDEALYTVRAQAIIRFGEWIDQSALAIDGLYSSLHPPLYVWLTAFMFQLFGEEEWSARFISALAGAATLPIIALLGKRLANPETGLVAALFFGLNPFVTFFARQGQLDSLLVFLLTLSVYYFVKALEEEGPKAPLLAGLTLGLALMTKLFVAFVIPAAVFLFVIRGTNRPGKIVIVRLVTALAVAATISIPWHAFMALTYADGNPLFFFVQSSLMEEALYGIEGHVQPLGILYYINQIIVLLPAAAFLFFSGVREFHTSRDSTAGLLWSLFILLFLISSLMKTKLAVYTLPMLVPISLLAATVLWNHVVKPFQRKSWFLLMAGTSFFLIWSFSQECRTAVKDVLRSLLSFQMAEMESMLLTGLLTGSGIMAIAFTYWMISRPWFPEMRRHIVIILLALPGGFTVINVAVNDSTRYKDGANEVASFVEARGFRRIVVAGSGRNSQLTYYLDGADIDWRNDISVRRIIPPSSHTAYTAWLTDELVGEPSTTLLLIEKDRFIRHQTIDPQHFVPIDYELVLDTRRYSAYLRPPADLLASLIQEPSNDPPR